MDEDTQLPAYQVDCRFYNSLPIIIPGNPEVKTASTETLIAELRNRHPGIVIGMIHQQPRSDGNIGKSFIAAFSGDLFMLVGVVERLKQLIHTAMKNSSYLTVSYERRDPPDAESIAK